jgi:DNA-binding transcriptional MerR regulator
MTVAETAARALSIAEAAEATGLSVHTLRYYERAGLLEPVDRNEGGHRRYRESDLELIRFLSRLRATGMPIRDVRRYAELLKTGDATTEQRLALLEAHREAVVTELEAIAECLELVDWKIGFYKDQLGRR